MRRFVTAVIVVVALWTGAVNGDSLTLSSTLSHAVFQRDASNVAQVPITGVFDGTATGIEVRAVPMDGYYGTATDWTEIATWPGSTFSGTLTVPAGWYQLEARAMLFDAEIASDALDSVGVGEVFITAGQSNSANHGTPAQTPSDSRVSTWNGTNWQFAVDPQPLATGTEGSPWPDFGSILVEHQQVPVGVIAVGVGATTVQQWLPGTSNYNKINSALAAAGPNGVRAVLWHQGESDAYASTSASTYASRLNSIIAQSRADAGYDVPWGVALASYLPSTTLAQEAEIVAGQQAVIAADSLVFQGASTNNFHEIGLVNSGGTHFNDAGLREHGQQWADAVVDYFDLPENTWGQGDPPPGPSVHAVELDTYSAVQYGPFSLGWRFTPNENMVVTALGVFDIAGDGVNEMVGEGQPVALFEWGGTDAGLGTRLVLETVPMDATAEAAGNANAYYVDIEPITLTAGTEYFVAAQVNSWDFAHSVTFLNDDNRPFTRSECAGFATTYGGSPAIPLLANTTTFTIGGGTPAVGTGSDDWFGGTFKYAVSRKPGDASGDGVVNAIDARILALYWLSSEEVGWNQGDFNGDGKVDDLDASILAANWEGGGEEIGVPEPGIFTLMLSLGFALLLYRRFWP